MSLCEGRNGTRLPDMLDQEIYLEQCVGIRRAGGHASCVDGYVGGAFLTVNELLCSDQWRIKENGSSAFANFKFVRLFRTILIMKANEMHYFSDLFDKVLTFFGQVRRPSSGVSQHCIHAIGTVFVMLVLLASASRRQQN